MITDNDVIAAMALVAQRRLQKLETMAQLISMPADDFAIAFGEWHQAEIPIAGWETAAVFCHHTIQRTGQPPWC